MKCKQDISRSDEELKQRRQNNFNQGNNLVEWTILHLHKLIHIMIFF